MKREPLNTSIPLPHFQSGSGMLNHTGGDYSHSGMIDYPRFPISELHLGIFPDSMEFQSWKVIFKTEVCTRTAKPHLTMHWIKEVEMAKSIGDRLTARSIVVRTDFPDYGVLDATVASALKKALQHADALPKKSKCRRAACSKTRPVLTCEKSAYMISEYFPCNRSL